jgi:hypothetical protein
MYYPQLYSGLWVIRHATDDGFAFGPFHSEQDAHFIAQLLETNKIKIVEDDDHGKEGTEDTDSVHEHTGE